MVKQDCILFDLDGTLLDTGDLIRASFEYTFAKEMGEPVPWEQLHKFWGRPLLDQMRLFADSPEKAQRMLEVYREHNARYHDELAKITPGAKETLKALKEAGKTIAVVTSKSVSMAKRGVKLFGLDQYLDALVGAEDTQRHKPDPAPVLLALEKLGKSPEEAIMVGDSPYDIEAGLRAGTVTAGLEWTIFPKESFDGREPHRWLKALSDLVYS
ncbi:MAG: HAD-IA family hydrolase [Firmicutes bacterium]|nr:HAD-IA family hydrolase [Bacillota bacterium]